MSVKIMGAVWELKLGKFQKLVLLAHADHANDEGICYPSIGRIAWKTELDPRTVKRINRGLRERGLLEPLRNQKGGRGLSTVYRVHPEKGERLRPYRG